MFVGPGELFICSTIQNTGTPISAGVTPWSGQWTHDTTKPSNRQNETKHARTSHRRREKENKTSWGQRVSSHHDNNSTRPERNRKMIAESRGHPLPPPPQIAQSIKRVEHHREVLKKEASKPARSGRRTEQSRARGSRRSRPEPSPAPSVLAPPVAGEVGGSAEGEQSVVVVQSPVVGEKKGEVRCRKGRRRSVSGRGWGWWLRARARARVCREGNPGSHHTDGEGLRAGEAKLGPNRRFCLPRIRPARPDQTDRPQARCTASPSATASTMPYTIRIFGIVAVIRGARPVILLLVLGGMGWHAFPFP